MFLSFQRHVLISDSLSRVIPFRISQQFPTWKLLIYCAFDLFYKILRSIQDFIAFINTFIFFYTTQDNSRFFNLNFSRACQTISYDTSFPCRISR